MQFIENEYTTSTKTEEELKKLTIEENLTELKRTFFILIKGQIIQKKAIYCNLHKILQEENACEQILPIILQDLKNKDEEIQISAAMSLKKAINLKFMKKDDLKILFQIMVLMLNLWNQNVIDAWVKVFHAFVQVIDHKEYEESINKLILSLTDISASEISRYGGAKMIGIMADIRKEGVQGILFEQGRLLCSDKDYDVRKVMAGEVLEKLSKNLDPFSIQIYLMPKIFQLVYDKEANVKQAGVKLLFSIIEYLAVDEQQNRLTKIFLEMMELGQEEVFLTLTEIQGNVFLHLAQYYIKNSQQMKIITEFLIKQTKHENVQVRKNFAYAFPGVLKLLGSNLFTQIYKYYKKMILEDEEPSISQCLISSLHEIAKIIGEQETKEKLYDILRKLLKNQDKKTLGAISQNIANILKGFYIQDEFQIDSIILSLQQNKLIQINQDHKDQLNSNQIMKLNKNGKNSKIYEDQGLDGDDFSYYDNSSKVSIKLEEQQKYERPDGFLSEIVKFQEFLNESIDWRSKVSFYNNIKNIIAKFNQEMFYKEFVERCYEQIKKENWHVKKAIISLIVYFLSVNYNQQNSKRIIEKFIKSFKESNSYQNRMAFIEFFAEGSQNFFSQKFFRINNLLCVLDLIEDQIYNVRVKLVQNLHRIRYMINENEDSDDDSNLDNQLLFENYQKVKKQLFKDEKLKNDIIQATNLADQMDFEDDLYLEKRKIKEKQLQQYETKKQQIYKELQQKSITEQDNSDLELRYDINYSNRGYLKMKKPTYKSGQSSLINMKKSTKLEKKSSKLIGKDFGLDINNNHQGKRSSFDSNQNQIKKQSSFQITSRQSNYLITENKLNNYIRKKSAQKEERDKLPSLYNNGSGLFNGSEQLQQKNKSRILNSGTNLQNNNSGIGVSQSGSGSNSNSNNMSIEQIKKSKLHHKYDDIKPRIYTGYSRKQA